MPLNGIRVVELAGLAPGPLCGKFLRDYGASVITVEKATRPIIDVNFVNDGKRSMVLDLKSKAGIQVFHRLATNADVLIDPFRKGVMEKLGLGPSVLMDANPKLIYARLTGYGQNGYLSSNAGHDINYLSISGLLSMFGWRGKHPTPPCNFSEFAGGSLMCFAGILLALLDRQKTGTGQMVDCNIVEGVAYIGSWMMRARDIFDQPRGKNLIDGGSHYYDTYETKDGKFMAVGALEPQFYKVLLDKLNLTYDEIPHFPAREDGGEILSRKFKEKTQQEWCEIFDQCDACVTPVLTLQEAAQHKHNVDRQAFFVNDNGIVTPVRSPRLSNHPANASYSPPPSPGAHSIDILREHGYSEDEIKKLVDQDVVKCKL